MFNKIFKSLVRSKFSLSGFILLLPFYFLYQSLNPEFPAVWQSQMAGNYEVSPMPFDMEQPYSHHGVFVKDFMLIFSKGEVKTIRQAYLNIGTEPLPLSEFQKYHEGILHGSRHGQHVHALTNAQLVHSDKVWLTIENWQGEISQASWILPTGFTIN